MTRTSKALKRLGIAGLAAVTIGAGVPALVATPAQAAGPVTSVTINPTAKTGAAGVCLNYTLTARDATNAAVPSATITVTLSTNPANAQQDVSFCSQAQTGYGDGTVANQPAPQAGTSVSTQGPQATGTSTDVSRFITDGNGNVTIGVTSNVPGGANIQPFVDSNNNGVFNAGELAGQSATATWRTGGPAGSDANANAATAVAVTPNPDAAVVGEARTYKVTVSNTSGDPLAGVTPVYTVSGAETQGPVNCPSTDNNGVSRCTVTFTKTGTSTVTFFVNQNSNPISTPGLDPSEPRGTSTVTVQAAPTAGAQSVTATCLAVGGPQTQTTTSPCVNEVRDQTRVVRFVVENTSTSNAATTVGTLLAFAVTGGSGDETVNPTECSTADFTPGAGDTGTSTTNSFCDVTVNDPTPVSGEVLTVSGTIRGTTTRGTATVTFRNQPIDARNITLAPKTATTAPNTARTFTATVIDSDGKPVQGVSVTFTETGAGAFRNGSSSVTTTTDANGQASTEVISLPGETGSQTITATIDAQQANGIGGTSASQCGNAANTGNDPRGVAFSATKTQSAGNCSDTATNTFSTASPSPTGTSTRAALTLVVNTPTVAAGSTARLTATGAANEAYQLMCYSRPSTTFVLARSGTFNAAGDAVTFTLSLGRNTRCFIQYATTSAQGASPSVVVNVRTVLSLSTVRTGVRTYVFQGRNLPRVAGQLITLYRVDAAGNEIRTSNLVTDNSGIYRVTRTFTGTGSFLFRVRTSQTLNNASGVSNTITVRVF